MSEKKVVAYDYTVNYKGPFDIIEFFGDVDKWIEEKGFEKELKEHKEHVKKDGKDIEWTVECWKMLTPHRKEVVRLNAIFSKVKEVTITRDKKKRKINNGEVLINIDGLQESHLAHQWESNPLYSLFWFLINRFVYFLIFKYDKIIAGDTENLHSRVKSFFNLQKRLKA